MNLDDTLILDDEPGSLTIDDDGEGVLLLHTSEDGGFEIRDEDDESDDEALNKKISVGDGDEFENLLKQANSATDSDFTIEDDEDAVGAPLRLDTAFNNLLNQRAAIDVPLLRPEPPPKEKREFPLDTGPVFGTAGDQVVVTLTPQCLFRATKVIATDNATPAGNGTRITMINVGQRVQRMGAGGTLTAFFPAFVLGNGVDFDTNEPYEQIQITVSFIQACTWEMSLFGEAVI